MKLKKLLLIFFVLLLVKISFASTVFATRGCCSYHQGVNYCDTSTGRDICNDGTYSPTCGCALAPQIAQPISSQTYLQEAPTDTPFPTPTLIPSPTMTFMEYSGSIIVKHWVTIFVAGLFLWYMFVMLLS